MPLPVSKLRPFRDYNEKDVINVFTLTGVSLPVGNGLLVTPTGGGWIPEVLEVTEMLGDYGQGQGQSAFLNNVQAQRYGALPKVTACSPGSTPLGITLYDMAEVDENGEPLRYNPRKAAEMECVISGQAIPIVTKGIFEVTGAFDFSVLSSGASGIAIAPAITAGAPIYPGNSGLFCTSGQTIVTTAGSGFYVTVAPKIGMCLGGTAPLNFTSGTTDQAVFIRLSL